MGRSRGVRGERTEHTQLFSRILADLVLHGIRKSTFQHLTVNWNFNVLEMTLETFHFVPGLSRTPLLYIPRYPTNICSRKSRESEIWKPESPKTQVHSSQRHPKNQKELPDACLMVHGCPRCMLDSSWLMAQGSWPREARGPQGRAGPWP